MLPSTHLYREIYEQPATLEAVLKKEQGNAQALAEAIRARDISYVVIAARGTSDNAARYAQYVLGTMNGLPVALAAPSQFTLYKRPPRFRDALVLGISQSGKSPDIVAVLAEARRQGALTATITNSPDSELSNQGDFVIQLDAGQEQAVAATKTYSAELAAIALLSATLAGDSDLLDSLNRIPDAVAEALKVEEQVAQLAPRYRYMSRCVVIGRGYNYATACELALKLKELTYTIVEPYSSADFLHGPLAMITHDFPVVVFAPSGDLLGETQNFIRTLQGRKAEVLCISDDEATRQMTPLQLPVRHSVPEWLSPLTMIVPGQLLSMHLAAVRGYDIDSPRGLKKVTQTR